jgi:hypothetical protein
VLVTKVRSQRPIVVYDDKENIDDGLTFLEARTLDREASTPGVLAATSEPTQLPSPPDSQGQQKRAPTGARNKSWYKVDPSQPCQLATALATGLINPEQREEERKKENLRLRGGTGGRGRAPRRSDKWPEMSPETIAEQEILFSDEGRERNRAWVAAKQRAEQPPRKDDAQRKADMDAIHRAPAESEPRQVTNKSAGVGKKPADLSWWSGRNHWAEKAAREKRAMLARQAQAKAKADAEKKRVQEEADAEKKRIQEEADAARRQQQLLMQE